jgi:hypothetical protein
VIPAPLVLAALLAAEPVQLEQGKPAPYAGALCDDETARTILEARRQAERERDDCRAQLAQPAPSAGWVAVVVAFALGLAGGVVLGVRASR